MTIPQIGPHVEKVVDFTRTEDIGLRVWLEAVLIGEFALAQRILTTCLLAEHYRSVLPDSLSDAGAEELEILTDLQGDFDRALQAFRDRNRAKVDEREDFTRERPFER